MVKPLKTAFSPKPGGIVATASASVVVSKANKSAAEATAGAIAPALRQEAIPARSNAALLLPAGSPPARG